MKRYVRSSIRDLKEYERVEIPDNRSAVRDAIYSFADKEGDGFVLESMINWFDTDELRTFIEHVYDLRSWQYVKD